MSEKINIPDADPSIRPEVAPEQMRAFRVAYAELMKKATITATEIRKYRDGKYGDFPTYMGVTKPNGGVKFFTKNSANIAGIEFIQNLVGGPVMVNSGYNEIGDVYGRVYTYTEDLTHKTGELGEFVVDAKLKRDDGEPYEQDRYTFYPDGNIGKRHYIDTFDQETDQETEEVLLNTEEINQLAFQIADAHFEYPE